MSFEVTILGCGAALPTSKRKPTSQFVNCNERFILIDCGEGTQNQLRKYGIKFQRINHILISHLHGDHFFGLIGLLSTMHLLGRDKGLTIYGPKELEQIIRIQLEVGGSKIGFKIKFVVLDNPEGGILFEDNLIEIRYFPMRHRIPTNGFRIQEKPKERSIIGEEMKANNISLKAIPFFRQGLDFTDENGQIHFADEYSIASKTPKSYGYCSDTSYFEPIIPHIKNVDVLYHEATFLEAMSKRAKETFHSTAKQAAEIAVKAGVKKLLLGHLSARYESNEAHEAEAKTVFENTEAVEDGMTYLVR